MRLLLILFFFTDAILSGNGIVVSLKVFFVLILVNPLVYSLLRVVDDVRAERNRELPAMPK